MPRRIDFTGQTIGLVYVMHRVGTQTGNSTWRVRCRCGKERVVNSNKFYEMRKYKTCGCAYQKPKKGEIPFKQGHCRGCGDKLPPTKYFKCEACYRQAGDYWDMEVDYGFVRL